MKKKGETMKRLLFAVLFLMLAIPCLAADVELAWDASVSTNVEGYALFSRDYQDGYGVEIWSGPGLGCTVTVPDDRQTAFVARAWGYGSYDLDGNREVIWSLDSNEVVFIPEIEPPAPPTNIFIQILVAVLDFFAPSLG